MDILDLPKHLSRSLKFDRYYYRIELNGMLPKSLLAAYNPTTPLLISKNSKIVYVNEAAARIGYLPYKTDLNRVNKHRVFELVEFDNDKYGLIKAKIDAALKDIGLSCSYVGYEVIIVDFTDEVNKEIGKVQGTKSVEEIKQAILNVTMLVSEKIEKQLTFAFDKISFKVAHTLTMASLATRKDNLVSIPPVNAKEKEKFLDDFFEGISISCLPMIGEVREQIIKSTLAVKDCKELRSKISDFLKMGEFNEKIKVNVCAFLWGQDSTTGHNLLQKIRDGEEDIQPYSVNEESESEPKKDENKDILSSQQLQQAINVESKVNQQHNNTSQVNVEKRDEQRLEQSHDRIHKIEERSAMKSLNKKEVQLKKRHPSNEKVQSNTKSSVFSWCTLI